MAKLTLNNVSSGLESQSLINNNNDTIEAAFEDTISRSGATPNDMQADLDLGSNNLLNVADGVNPTDGVNLGQVRNLLSAAGSGLISSNVEYYTATAGQTSFNVTTTFYPGTDNLRVYVNGVLQNRVQSYTENSAGNQVTFVEALEAGDIVTFITNDSTTSNVTNATNVTYNTGTASQSVSDYLDALPFRNLGYTPVYVSGTSLKVTGTDVTDELHVGRLLRLTDNATIKYGVIKTTAFSTDTTITFDNLWLNTGASTTLTNNLTILELSIARTDGKGGFSNFYPPRSGETGVVDYSYPWWRAERWGVVADTAVDQATKINSALSSAAATNISRIELPPGVIDVSGITMQVGVDLIGHHQRGTTLRATGSAEIIDWDAGVSNLVADVLVRDIYFIGDTGDTTTGLVKITKYNWVTFERCRFGDAQASGAIGLELVNCYEWYVRSCKFDAIDTTGIKLSTSGGTGSNNGVIWSCEFNGNNEASFIGVDINTAQNVIIGGGCNFEGAGNAPTAIQLVSSNTITITDNYIEQWTADAVKASGGSNTNIIIRGNVLNTTGGASHCVTFNAASNDQIHIYHNRFADQVAGRDCMVFGSATNVFHYDNDYDTGHASDLVVSDNINGLVASGQTNFYGLTGTGTVTVSSLPDGSSVAATATVTGAAVGDPVVASIDGELNNILVFAYVQSANTVRFVMQNIHGAAITLNGGAAATFYVNVLTN